MYKPLRISPNTPALVRRLIQHLDMLLGDVHAMLRLPLKEEGLTHGCNFAAATVLVEIIGGVSSTLFMHGKKSSGLRYKTLLRNFYPWADEGCADPDAASNLLYKFIRNPLAHELGVGGKKGGIGKSGLPEDLIEQLELSTTPTQNSTIQFYETEDTLHLDVAALYWGTRAMIQRLTEDATIMKEAEAYLSKNRQG